MYWARPGWTRRRSLLRDCCRCPKASGPTTRTEPRWLTSKATAEWRHARCSATVPDGYASGISQPPKGTSFAPSATCASCSGETRDAAPSPLSPAFTGPDYAAPATAGSRPCEANSEVKSRWYTMQIGTSGYSSRMRRTLRFLRVTRRWSAVVSSMKTPRRGR